MALHEKLDAAREQERELMLKLLEEQGRRLREIETLLASSDD